MNESIATSEAMTGSSPPSEDLVALELLASVVRGEAPAWPVASPQTLEADVLRVAAEQGGNAPADTCCGCTEFRVAHGCRRFTFIER